MSPTTRWCHSCIFSSQEVTTFCRRHIIKMVLQHSWLKQIKKHTRKAGKHTPGKLENIPANHRFAKMCFLFAHCQGTAKHKLTFGNLRLFSKGNKFASDGAGTQFAMGKLSLLYFTILNHTWSQFLKASLNYWTTFWAEVTVSISHCFHSIMYPKWRGAPLRIDIASLLLAIINQNVLFLEVSVRPVAVRSPLPAIFQCHLWTA